jgi:hypothetical protein
MNDKQLKAVVDYINRHAAALHGVKPGKLDVGPDLTVEMVKQASIQGSNVIVVADRGIKGTPKYVVPVKDLEADAPPPKLVEEEKPRRGR